MAKRRKDPSDKKSVPTRANSKMDSEEQEFWNLDDSSEEDPTGAAEESAKDSSKDSSKDLEDEHEDDDLDDIDELDDIDDSGMNEDEDNPGGTPDDQTDDTEGESEPAADNTPPADDQQPDRPRSGKAEKIALGLLSAVILSGVIWGAMMFLGSLPDGANEDLVEFPVKGTSVIISSADTYWRNPDRTKDKGVRMDTRLIPAAVIKLSNESGNCALRFFISDDKGDFVGDSTTRTVSGGKFESSGTTEVEVYGTAGFHDPGDHAAYSTEQIDTWHLVVKEGPDRNATGAEFKEIARVPISYNRK